jgi:hypothetical protein
VAARIHPADRSSASAVVGFAGLDAVDALEVGKPWVSLGESFA